MKKITILNIYFIFIGLKESAIANSFFILFVLLVLFVLFVLFMLFCISIICIMEEYFVYDSKEELVAAPVIKDLVYYVLKNNPGELISLKTLKKYVRDISGEEFSNGSFSGAMRDLIEENNGRILNVTRGFYVYLEDLKKQQINFAIKQLIIELDNIATDNILDLTEKDMRSIMEIPDLKRHLNAILLP